MGVAVPFTNKVLGMDDLRASANIFCAVLGIGSLGIGSSMAQAGPVLTSLILILMAFVNIYATNCLSKCCLVLPAYVQTFSDIGEYAMGKTGRYLVLVPQMANCFSTPIAFLVLGGSYILPLVFRDVWSGATANIWIPIMAIVLLPVVWIRTLKEAAIFAFLGFLGAFVGDVAAVAQSLSVSPYYSDAGVKLTFANVFSVFGTMALAYGLAIVIPSIQRDHKKPENMPFVITWSMIIITVIYLILGLLEFYQYGCVTPSSLLKSMSADAMQYLANIAFFVHIAIAFAVLLNPALYLLERQFLGFYKTEQDRDSKLEGQDTSVQGSRYDADRELNEAGRLSSASARMNRKSIGSHIAELDYVGDNEVETQVSSQERVKSIILRTGVVAIMVFIAMFLQSSFDDLAGFIGATSVTMANILMPIVLYMRVFAKTMKTPEKIMCYVILVVCTVLGVYSAYKSVVNIADNISHYTLFKSEKPVASADRVLNTDTCSGNPVVKL